MGYDPLDYTSEAAPQDFAPLTDAQIVLGLLGTDPARPAVIQSLAVYVAEALGLLLHSETPSPDALVSSFERFRARAW